MSYKHNKFVATLFTLAALFFGSAAHAVQAPPKTITFSGNGPFSFSDIGGMDVTAARLLWENITLNNGAYQTTVNTPPYTANGVTGLGLVSHTVNYHINQVAVGVSSLGAGVAISVMAYYVDPKTLNFIANPGVQYGYSLLTTDGNYNVNLPSNTAMVVIQAIGLNSSVTSLQAALSITGMRVQLWGPTRGEIPAVPEPTTYAMLIGGLALVGWMALRRRRDADQDTHVGHAAPALAA